MKVVIVGGVAGGASAAARLRRLDEKAEIIMFERGSYISYANCGLPYYVGGEITDKGALTLQTPESFHSRFQIDVRINSEVTAVNPASKSVTVKNLVNGNTYEETYDSLILSPGAEPIKPQIPGIDDKRIFTLRNIPDTYRIREYIEQEKPKTAVVVGGGYIGIEMAENLIKAGLSVTVVELADHVIGSLDYDMACDVHRYLKSKGVHLLLGNGVKAFHPKEKDVEVELTSGVLRADLVLLSVGVRPDSKLAKEAGLQLNTRGAIRVNTHMRTSNAHIYAVGDAVEITDFITGTAGFIPLAGPANKQGRIAADNICGYDSKYKDTQGSSVLKLFDMTVATTGINERAAQMAGLNYDKLFTYSASHATYYPGASNMSIKTIFEKETGRILGAQLVGFEGVDKRCDVLATAIRANMTAFDLTELELSYAPPFSSAKDPVNMIGFAIENLITDKVKQYHWYNVAELPSDGSVTLLDTRTSAEYARGHIDGTIHIPLDSLREHLDKLDKNKPVYVNCQSGLRSYIACRILSQNGFDCYNLSGGYRLYESVMADKAFDCTPNHPCGMKI
ncbi:FAD-dependent oxidoreductase [Oscillospiraceae bacterium PP1C4]